MKGIGDPDVIDPDKREHKNVSIRMTLFSFLYGNDSMTRQTFSSVVWIVGKSLKNENRWVSFADSETSAMGSVLPSSALPGPASCSRS